MFDVGASELLLIVIVAVVVIGPKDLPLALRAAGRWIAKIRRVSNHFRAGIETMIREAELEEMERKWREQNAAIMAGNPAEGQGAEHAADQIVDQAAPVATPAVGPVAAVPVSGDPHGQPAGEAPPP